MVRKKWSYVHKIIYLYTNFNQKIKCNLINEYVLSVFAFSSVYDHH